MSEINVSRGRIVVFTPSVTTQEKFKNKQHENYPAIVTDVNDETVSLTVFGVGEEVHVKKVKHVSIAAENRSSWDWPQMKK